MKQIVTALVFTLTAVGVHADLVLQQQIATPNYTGVTTMMIKGTKVRMDMYAGEPRAWSLITDLNTGEIITLVHGSKTFLKGAGTPAKRGKSTGAQSPVLRPTGQTQKVGSYDTQLYGWSNARGMNGTAWVALNYPDYERIRADIAVLDRTISDDNDTSPALSTLPGMVVRSQVAGGGQTITMALISAKEGPLDKALFAVPRDYKTLPQTSPVQPATAQPASQKAANKSTPTSAAPAPTSKGAPPPAQKLPAW